MKLLSNEIELPTGLIVPKDVVVARQEAIAEREKGLREMQTIYKEALRKDMAVARREEAEKTLSSRRARLQAKGRRSHMMHPDQVADTYLGFDKPRFPTHQQLRTVARESVVISAAHQRRHLQLRVASNPCRRDNVYALGWNMVHKDFGKRDFEMSESQTKRADEIMEIFLAPHETESSFQEFIYKAMVDYLTIDRVAVELIPSRLAEIAPGVKKNTIVGFCITDGATIKPIPEAAVRWVRQDEKYKDLMVGDQRAEKIFTQEMRSRFGIEAEGKAYIQFVDGIPMSAFSEKDMIVQVTCPRPELGGYGYGESCTEKAIVAVLADMQTWAYQVNNFSEALPEILLCIAGAISEDLVGDVEDQIAEMAMGVKRHRRIPLIQTEEKGGIQSVQLRKSLAEMGFGEWETRTTSIALAHFGMHPYEINQANVPNGQSTLQEANKDAEIELHSQGFLVVLLDLDRLLNRIVERIDPDYRFRWFGVPGLYDKQDKEEQDLEAARAKTFGSISISRDVMGLPPLDVDHFKKLGNSKDLSVQLATLSTLPTDMHQQAAVLINADRQLRQEEKLEAQQAQQQGAEGQPGQPGQPPPEGGGGDEDQPTDDPELNQMLQGIDLNGDGGGEGEPPKKAAKGGPPLPAGKGRDQKTQQASKKPPAKMRKSWDDVIRVTIR